DFVRGGHGHPAYGVYAETARLERNRPAGGLDPQQSHLHPPHCRRKEEHRLIAVTSMGRWMGKAVRITAAVLGVVLGAVGGALFPAIAGAFSSPAAAGAAHEIGRAH